MDFDYAHEHELLRASLRRALAQPGRGACLDDGAWQRCIALGLGALDCREETASRDDLVCMMIAQEEIGRSLAVVPFSDTIVQAAALLRTAGNAAQRERHLVAIEHGTAVLTIAHDTSCRRLGRTAATVTAQREGDAWRLDGESLLVSFADRADAIVVPARSEGHPGLTLFVVPATTRGLARIPVSRHDGHPAADLCLQGATVPDTARLGHAGDDAELLDSARRMAIVALAAEAVGCMDALLQITAEHLRTRRQFGRPLGSFQALQHRTADMYVAAEQARSMMLFATMSASDPDPEVRARAIAATKVQIGRSARFVGQQAIQLHGGMGLADECSASHYFRRLTALELAFGDADDHLALLGERGGLFEPAAP